MFLFFSSARAFSISLYLSVSFIRFGHLVLLVHSTPFDIFSEFSFAMWIWNSDWIYVHRRNVYRYFRMFVCILRTFIVQHDKLQHTHTYSHPAACSMMYESFEKYSRNMDEKKEHKSGFHEHRARAAACSTRRSVSLFFISAYFQNLYNCTKCSYCIKIQTFVYEPMAFRRH